MVLGVMEGQIRGGYFPDYIFDPSVVDCSGDGAQQVPDLPLARDRRHGVKPQKAQTRPVIQYQL